MSGLLLYIQANPMVGTSPLLRSLDLAKNWKEAGGEVFYVVGQLPATMLRKLATVGCEVIKPNRPQAPDELAKSLWQYAEERDCDWLATDDSRPDLVRMIAATKIDSKNYLVLGDSTNNPTVGVTMVSGDEPSFALLRPNHSNQPLPKVAPRRSVRRVMIELCRMDGDRSAEFVRCLCKRFQSTEHIFDIVTPFATAAANQLHEQQHPMRQRITWHKNADRIFMALFCFDLAISADTACFFETAHSGLPGILLETNADRARRMKNLTSLTSLPWRYDLAETDDNWSTPVCDQIAKLCSSPKAMATHSQEMSKLVDAHGAARLVTAMKNFAEERAGKVKSA